MNQSRLARTAETLSSSWRKLRRRFHPRSVLVLLLFGFMLVAAPLVIGLLVSGQQIERVTRESEAQLVRAVGITQAAREVFDRLVASERAARQYRVLRDREARANYSLQRDAFQIRVEGFSGMDINDAMAERLAVLVEHESGLAAQVLSGPGPEEWPPALATGFRELDVLARELIAESEASAVRAIARLEELGAQARAIWLIQLALIIPFAGALAVVFTNLIIRPIRRLDRAIRSLARPGAQPIEKVEGPRDLRALSVRLEWVRRKLARTERDRRRLLGQVSHELKTPLSAIREGISLMDDELLGKLSAGQVEVISILKSNVDRLQEQIETLLRYNRLHAGLKPAEQRSLSVAELVDDVLSTHALAIAARAIRTDIKIDDGLRVTGDGDMLHTALDNLVSNALKFSQPGGTVGIFAGVRNPSVIIEVADNGPGIRPAERERVFEPFFRGQGSANTKVPGSGLGLAICHDLVRAHGGEVGLAERPGWTTVFRVSLPRHAGEESVDETG